MSDEKRSPGDGEMTSTTRRVVLKAGGGVVLTAIVPLPLVLGGCGGGSGGLNGDGADAGAAGVTSGPTTPVSFLSESQINTLRAAVDRFIPGQPEDPDPGAVVAGVAEAISLFLGAFLTDPPFIFAGGPFSDRAGGTQNDFASFIPLDPYEETAWRLLIEGSRGRPELEFNGPVVGHQQIYIDGLARLDERAGGDFAGASAMDRDDILNDDSDPVVAAFVDVAYPDTLELMYGPPEYGGNQGLVGWTNNDFDGDVQPDGYTDDQVINADNPGPLDFLLPPSYGMGNNPARRVQQRKPASGTVPAQRSPTLHAMAAGDSIAAAMGSSNGSRAEFHRQLAHLLKGGRRNA